MAALRIGLLSAWLAPARGLTWIKAGTGEEAVCAGIEDTCDSVDSCTRVAFGACGGLEAPAAYAQQEIVGLALVKGDDGAYLTNGDLLEVVHVSNVEKNGYRKYSADLAVGTAKYAMVNSGAFFGENPDVSGCYLGTASYVMQSGSVSSNMMAVTVATKPGTDETTKYDVCIAKKTDGACGAELAWETGAYKFSLFGYTRGEDFKVATDHIWFGVRVDVGLKGFGSQVEVTFNGDETKTLDTIGTADVTMLKLKELTGDKREIAINFPLNYNFGDVSGDFSIPGGSKNVKIKVSKNGEENIFVDYLFEMADFQVKDKYFMYDPTVTQTSASSTATQEVSSAPSMLSVPAGLIMAGLSML